MLPLQILKLYHQQALYPSYSMSSNTPANMADVQEQNCAQV